MTKTKTPRTEAQQQRAVAREVMGEVYDLARQAYLARARFIAQGVRVEPLKYDEAVRAVLGIRIPPRAAIATPEPKPGIVTATVDQIKRLLG